MATAQARLRRQQKLTVSQQTHLTHHGQRTIRLCIYGNGIVLEYVEIMMFSKWTMEREKKLVSIMFRDRNENILGVVWLGLKKE